MRYPTRNHGGTIDPAFCLECSAKFEIFPDLETTSDHETLVRIMRCDFRVNKETKLRCKDLDTEIFLRLLGNDHQPFVISSREDLETEIKIIVETIYTALL